MDFGRFTHRTRRLWVGRKFRVWHDPCYRLPFAGLGGVTGFEPRRADYAAWYFVDTWVLPPSSLRTPRRINYQQLARVHSPAYLESLSHPRTLARIFAVDESDVVVDEVLKTVRLAAGGTVQAALWAERTGGTALNLFGGFHHAAPDQGGGFCAVNDIAAAIAELRHRGCQSQIVILDLDAHPPDGLAAYFGDDATVWVGSLSGEDWGSLVGVDETVLPRGCDDATYLRALDGLLERMPEHGPAPSGGSHRPRLAFVIAGGDVLASDRLGRLGLSVDGVRQRDARVATALRKVPSVWLPGGGYNENAWRVIAGTGLVLACRSLAPIPEEYEPMRARFRWIASKLSPATLAGETGELLTTADLEESLGLRANVPVRFLDYYTAEGVEHALSLYGITPHMRRLGYDRFEVTLKRDAVGDTMRVTGHVESSKHLLIEITLARRGTAGAELLYVHWLTLRNPRAQFSRRRPQLPGQDAPGLGLASEMGWVLARMARRLGLGGVGFRPAWYHTAYAARYHFVFMDSARHGRFEAMMRDLKEVPLRVATHAIADGRLQMNGEPYAWEPEEMAFWLRPSPLNPRAVAAERERVRFTVTPA